MIRRSSFFMSQCQTHSAGKARAFQQHRQRQAESKTDHQLAQTDRYRGGREACSRHSFRQKPRNLQPHDHRVGKHRSYRREPRHILDATLTHRV